MKAFAALLALSICCLAIEPAQFKDHPFFKHMVGEWACEGELKGADGNVFSFKEEWKGEFVGETTFSATGKRDINGQAMNFECTFIRDPATGRIEATQIAKAETAVTERYEVSASADGSKIELTALGDSGNKTLHVVLEFRKSDYALLHSRITASDESGTVVASGELVNKRAVKP
jgi:hypothetical protein